MSAVIEVGMVAYEPDSSLRSARARYFEDNGFGRDGGYDSAWVDFKLGPIPFPFPNTAPRKRAVQYHDLHHILTGYETSFAGELEISAWEIASGCKSYAAAWQLNLGGMAAGALGMPRRTWAAFRRGRNSRNLYGTQLDDVLELSVGDVRRELGIDDPVARSSVLVDALLYAAAVIFGLAIGLLSFVVFLPFALVLGPVFYVIERRQRRQRLALKT
jgi:hypothetical protein